VALWHKQQGQGRWSFHQRWLRKHAKPITCLAFSPDSQALALADYDNAVRLWEAQTGKERATLGEHGGLVFSVAYSRDGKSLASAGDDGTAKIWDVATHKAHTLPHLGPVRGVAFSPDGQRLASAGAEGTVRLWDVVTRQEILTLKGVAGPFSSVAFSPDGKRLAAASTQGIVQVWDARRLTPELLAQREALNVVQFLLARGLPKDEVVRRIAGDATISASVRQQARRLAKELQEPPE
jgi:WD40 repeat protein